MVRMSLSSCALALAFAAPLLASASAPVAAPTAPTAPRPLAATATATPPSVAPAARKPRAPEPDWRSRVAITVQKLQTEAPELLARLTAMQPNRHVEDEQYFTQPELHDPRAAAVLLRRLLQGEDPVKVRCAIVDALPHTGGDWQEGAASLASIDASPKVRKKLIEIMRYADEPHAIVGLRFGFKDEDPEVNIAAVRTAGFSRSGPALFTELYSSTFDADWDLRAAAVQALGMLKLPQSRDVLIKALADDDREVRLQALLALEQLDPDGLIWLPEVDRLARDRKSHRIARKAELLLRKRRAAKRQGGHPPAAAGGSGPTPAASAAP